MSTGNHGLDIEHPDGTTFIHPDQAKFKTLIGGLKACYVGSQWWMDKI